jgi:4-hydroxy-tetrahydrodipicolinate reductase
MLGLKAEHRLKIAIAGCAGLMGQALIRRTLITPAVELAAGSVREGNKGIGQEIGSLIDTSTPGVKLTSDSEELFVKADAVIDFTTPEHSLRLAELAGKHEKILVCGTTGLKESGLAILKKHARAARIVCSPNMSIGINLLLGLVERVAGILPPEDCDIEIDEMHHRLKVDAPSGTALTLGAAAARGRKVQLANIRCDYQQAGLGARRQGAIGFSVRRGGDVVGDHTVTFAMQGERIELAHKSTSRDIYAAGAIRAALWAKHKPPGFYTMKDVLGV